MQQPSPRLEPTFTDVGLWAENIALGALASEAARGVSAKAIVTQKSVHSTLINVCEQRRGESFMATNKKIIATNKKSPKVTKSLSIHI